jgi:hypothetical protein
VTDETEQKAQRAKTALSYKRGQLVSFVFANPHNGDQVQTVGVVTLGSDGGGSLVVRPLAAHDVTVDPADVEPVVIDEV